MSGHIVFNHIRPDLPPDVIFGSNDYSFMPDLEDIEVIFFNFIWYNYIF